MSFLAVKSRAPPVLADFVVLSAGGDVVKLKEDFSRYYGVLAAGDGNI